mmetsp:Transcript_17890/g.48300  ORF Transcript_17890/g.48300 Transcript_17890/m.48300 type:complete len:253 (-) Transcript_17890:461-1219(-)
MGAQGSTAKRIERAEKTGVFALRDQGLAELPERIFSLKNLRTLDVGNNKLLKLPDAVGRCSMLLTISVDGNKLKILPSVICNLGKLENLSASGNLLTGLPGALGSLKKLKKLAVANNQLAALPDSIGACSDLATLDCAHNAIATLPASFGKLTSLNQADLSYNKLGSPLVAGLGGLKRIKSLDLRENVAILELPAELLRDTPVHRLGVDPHLLGKDGLLVEMEGSAEYLQRRKARIDQEVAGKAKGGEIAFD